MMVFGSVKKGHMINKCVFMLFSQFSEQKHILSL